MWSIATLRAALDHSLKVDKRVSGTSNTSFSLPFSALPWSDGPSDHAGPAWILVRRFVLLPGIYIYIVNPLSAPAARCQYSVSKMFSKSLLPTPQSPHCNRWTPRPARDKTVVFFSSTTSVSSSFRRLRRYLSLLLSRLLPSPLISSFHLSAPVSRSAVWQHASRPELQQGEPQLRL